MSHVARLAKVARVVRGKEGGDEDVDLERNFFTLVSIVMVLIFVHIIITVSL